MAVTIQRQKPPAPKRVVPNGQPIRGEPGSVLSEAVPVSEVKDSWIKMLLYGPNGVGKTTLACTFEKPLLLIAMERSVSGGARSVRKQPGVSVIRPGAPLLPDGKPDFDGLIDSAQCVEKVERLAEELKRHNPFKTIVFDHVTIYQDHWLERITGKPLPVQNGFGKVTQDEYTERSEKVKMGLVPWFELPCHTVFIGKEKDHNPPKEERVSAKTGKIQPDLRPRFIRGLQMESWVSVELGGQTAGWLQDAVEFACRLYIDREVKMERVESVLQGQKHVDYRETGEIEFVRALRTKVHPNFFSRFRSDDPDKLPEAIVRPTYQKILAAIEGRDIPE